MAEYFGATVADIFNTMPKRFKPEEAKDVDIVIGYEATGEGGGKWTATIQAWTLKVEKVEGAQPAARRPFMPMRKFLSA